MLSDGRRDKALDTAGWFAGFARLGQPLDALTPRQLEFLQDDANVELIDVVNAELKHGSWLGHSYFHPFGLFGTDMDGIPLHNFWLRWAKAACGGDSGRCNAQTQAARHYRLHTRPATNNSHSHNPHTSPIPAASLSPAHRPT